MNISSPQLYDSPGYLLWLAGNRWQGAQRAALEPYDITPTQFALLVSLLWLQSDKTVTQHQLADHAKLDPATASQVLRALEQKGLIVRGPSITDKRALHIAATNKGMQVAHAAIDRTEQADQQFFAALGADTVAFSYQLKKLVG